MTEKYMEVLLGNSDPGYKNACVSFGKYVKISKQTIIQKNCKRSKLSTIEITALAKIKSAFLT